MFVSALHRLLGGLTLAAAVALLSAVQTGATPQFPIPDLIWSVTGLANSGYDHALAVDSHWRPHLLFQDPNTGILRYVSPRGLDTQFEDIAELAMSLPYLSFDLAVGPDDRPCLVYATQATGPDDLLDTTLQYGCRGESEWQLGAVDEGGGDVQLAFDAGGQPHIALIQDNAAVYLSYHDGQWWKETVATDSAHMGAVWLLLDGDGRPHVLYRGSDGAFEAVPEPGGLWAKTPLDVTGEFVPRLDSAGRLWWATVVTIDLGGHPPIYQSRVYLHRPDDLPDYPGEWIDNRQDWTYTIDFELSQDTPYLVYNASPDTIMLQWKGEAEEQWHRHPLTATSDAKLNLAQPSSGGMPRSIAFVQDNILHYAQLNVVFTPEGEHAYFPILLGKP